MITQRERWRALEGLFNAAVELPPNARATFVDAACAGDDELRAELRQLLAADSGAEHRLRHVVVGAATVSPDVLSPPTESARVGHYRLLRQLGRGGMGEVWLAERADAEYTDQVALKLMRPEIASAGLIRRFLSERQILADLKHPNISRLLDGGTAGDGQPYLVMEYIDGEPIDAYCDRRRLDVDQRIDLMLEVCSAVQLAHASLVVHRDIKPGNILVTASGVPKLLDFGIAKILGTPGRAAAPAETATGARLLTPSYASPEQLRGEPVTTVSDVYALGVVLYELLTGRLPYRLESDLPHEIAEAVLTLPPERPSAAVARPVSAASSTRRHESGVQDSDARHSPPEPEEIARARSTTVDRLRRRLSGDLDTILLMALRKEPERRYTSVEQLARDLRAYRQGHPVAARPDRWSYRAAKFVGRHRGGVAAAVGAFVLLVFFAAAMAVQASRIARQRDVANLEREKAERVSGFLIDVFEASEPNRARGMDVTAREILGSGGRKVVTELRDQPEVQATAMEAIGRVYRGLGAYDSAATFLEGARARRQAAVGTQHPDYARSLAELGLLARIREDYERAERLHRQALAIRRARLGAEHEDVASSLNALAVVVQDRGRVAEAESLYTAALELYTRRFGRQHVETATILNNLGDLYTGNGRYESAITVLEEALAIRRRLRGNDHLDVAYTLNNLASAFEHAGRYDAAEPHYLESLAIRRKLLPDGHPTTLVVMNNLGGLRMRRGDYARAAAIFEEVVRYRRAGPLGGMALAVPLSNLASAENRMGRYDQAVGRFTEAIAIMRQAGGPPSLQITFPMHGLASSLSALRRDADAERTYREIVAIRRQAYGAGGHPNLVFSLDAFGSFLLDRGRHAEATPLLEEAVAIGRRRFERPHPYMAEALTDLGRLHLASGRAGAAEAPLREAVGIRVALSGEEHLATAQARSVLGRALLAAGREAEADSLLRASLVVLEREKAAERWLRPTREAVAKLPQ